jgi:hypothetical protein
MTTKHTVTDSRGQVHKRVSANRVYSHAIVVHFAYRPATGNYREWPAHTRVSWASRTDLAQKEACKYIGRTDIEGVEVIVATINGSPQETIGSPSRPQAQKECA